MITKGKFIVFEGLDGSGKSTQASLLQQKIQNESNRRVHLTCQPSDSIPGTICRGTLKGTINIEPETLSLMFAADRIEHIEKEILPQLEAGNYVICDRYYYSNFAYQSLNGSIDNVVNYNQRALNLLKPDITVFIDLPVEECNRRINANRAGEEMFENIESAKKIYSGYQEVFRRFNSDNIVIVTAQSKDDQQTVAYKVWQAIKNQL